MQTKPIAPKHSWLERWHSPGAVELLQRRIASDAVRARFHVTCAFTLLLQAFFCFSVLGATHYVIDPQQQGHMLLHVWSWIGLILLMIGAIRYVSSPICEEKEQGTLGLVKLTGISVKGIIQYLLGYGFLQGLLILILNLPILGLIVSCGGVSYQQIFAVVVTLAATAFLLGSLAFYLGVSSRNRQAATFFLTLFMGFYGIFLHIFQLLCNSIRRYAPNSYLVQTVLDWIELAATGLYYFFPGARLYEVLAFGYSGGPSSLFILFCILSGLAFLAGAERIFESHSDQIEPQKFELSKFEPRKFEGRRKRKSTFKIRQTKSKTPTKRRSERCWDNPFVWREFQFQKGGWKSVASTSVTSVFVFILFVVVAFLVLSTFGTNANSYGDALLGTSILWISLCIPGTVLSALVLFSTILSAEIKGKTLGTLFIISRTPREIMRELARGRLLLLTHSVVPFMLGLGGLAISFILPSSVWPRQRFDLWIALLFIGISLVAIPLIAYLGYFFCLLSIRLELVNLDRFRKVIVVCVSAFAILGLPIMPMFLQVLIYLFSNNTVLFTSLGIAITSLILSILLLPNLRRSIDRAIHKRMAEE